MLWATAGGGAHHVPMTPAPAPAPRLDVVVFDVPDIRRAASFYTDLAGWQPVADDGGDSWITLRTADGRGIAFQEAPDHVPPQWPGQERPQQLHLDLQVADHRAAADRAVSLGATRLAEGPAWITLADPAGHPFDLCQKDGLEGVGLFAATIDAPDASALARFYADLLALEVTHDGPEGALVAGDGQSVMFQQVSDYTAPRWPDPAYPQQAHLDLAVDDLDAAEPRALALGATPLPSDGTTFRVYADPAGHPFCLCAC